MISDDNRLEDIGGAIWSLQGCLSEEAPEFPLEPEFDEIVARIELKLADNRNPIRRKWFLIALEHAKRAREAFREGNPTKADSELSKSWDHLEQGNKAHRRRAAFIVSIDGRVEPAKEAQPGATDNPGDAQ